MQMPVRASDRFMHCGHITDSPAPHHELVSNDPFLRHSV
ncbi:hypothetical protein MA6G0728R_5007 [Mycobacteroides abscessus 6G-0728-R]|uniref:Uncharacterized protein n=1 Tax=Mycobacteroides abscessus 1948 TaxID=1299323 RepID=A0A829QME0_9MYCO|nr:hypothetical protein MA6G0125S_5077 [Mycobacteroides abscessus 6G-0125-S]EIU40274.1 hypothetical protein MA6G0125R_4036 [Mycobacteroides abscessus 6G-0125-R]EIU52534.1 hypothetical protein MA6G1108_5006 [Mycobacteroides abscessus 6G-1108]EIU54539.1 hypothetical protein MA6G0728S_4768 [Mycobacteroides abscessus 6G-0728-S]EIU90099.1 hypothetical protein MA6G0212_5063 [Mycobacteroides abscessus 6G-0212]EIU96191.1 hypothetical protein MA6G0728R_5007 [Mycobacteroides abscessus 6G-0728-R]EIV2075